MDLTQLKPVAATTLTVILDCAVLIIRTRKQENKKGCMGYERTAEKM